MYTIHIIEDNNARGNSCYTRASKIGTFERTYFLNRFSSISVSPHVNIRIPPTHFIETYESNIRVISTETS